VSNDILANSGNRVNLANLNKNIKGNKVIHRKMRREDKKDLKQSQPQKRLGYNSFR
jgi:hypothetical protein